MSIKIFEAYRVPLTRLREASLIINSQFLAEAYSYFCELCEMSKNKERPTEPVVDFLKREAKERSALSLDCGFKFWMDENYAYIIPYGKSVENPPEWFEDFHYQNQTDRPENVSKEDYESRLNAWKELGALDDTERMFVYMVIEGIIPIYRFERQWVKEWRAAKELQERNT